MATTVNMPNQFDATIRAMCEETMKLTVSALAAKYEFDLDEASRFMDATPLKIVRKRGPSTKSEEKKSVTKKKDQPKSKTKRGKTGYLLFGDDVRSVIREELSENLQDDEKLKPQDVVKEIAIRWKALDQDERDVWIALAKSSKSDAGSGSDDVSMSDAEE